jgi:hypothetical protein
MPQLLRSILLNLRRGAEALSSACLCAANFSQRGTSSFKYHFISTADISEMNAVHFLNLNLNLNLNLKSPSHDTESLNGSSWCLVSLSHFRLISRSRRIVVVIHVQRCGLLIGQCRGGLL